MRKFIAFMMTLMMIFTVAFAEVASPSLTPVVDNAAVVVVEDQTVCAEIMAADVWAEILAQVAEFYEVTDELHYDEAVAFTLMEPVESVVITFATQYAVDAVVCGIMFYADGEDICYTNIDAVATENGSVEASLVDFEPANYVLVIVSK